MYTLMNLRVFRSPESENQIFGVWSGYQQICVISKTSKQFIGKTPNVVSKFVLHVNATGNFYEDWINCIQGYERGIDNVMAYAPDFL